ncbi:hypothetical protein TrVE_jg13163 [Triparma verrucosa]|uniref:Uncharacterized protein n=1 Tax=Triparma verrucosa TaxID=1606542 RepID=A0A9W7BNT7_9STRA|nr:hypothetical protein TrVE_jg13163 [Triparma verrucosa]
MLPSPSFPFPLNSQILVHSPPLATHTAFVISYPHPTKVKVKWEIKGDTDIVDVEVCEIVKGRRRVKTKRWSPEKVVEKKKKGGEPAGKKKVDSNMGVQSDEGLGWWEVASDDETVTYEPFKFKDDDYGDDCGDGSDGGLERESYDDEWSVEDEGISPVKNERSQETKVVDEVVKKKAIDVVAVGGRNPNVIDLTLDSDDEVLEPLLKRTGGKRKIILDDVDEDDDIEVWDAPKRVINESDIIDLID